MDGARHHRGGHRRRPCCPSRGLSSFAMSLFSSSRLQARKVLGLLGPFFGLALVLLLFMAMLAWKDVLDQMDKEGLKGWGGWAQSSHTSPYDGLKAFLSVANIKTVLAQTVIVAVGALGMTM